MVLFTELSYPFTSLHCISFPEISYSFLCVLYYFRNYHIFFHLFVVYCISGIIIFIHLSFYIVLRFHSHIVLYCISEIIIFIHLHFSIVIFGILTFIHPSLFLCSISRIIRSINSLFELRRIVTCSCVPRFPFR